jgi:SAM-dependent methyltransferase
VRRVSAPADHVAIIGAGTSALVGDLVAAGYRHVYAVDISDVALGQLRASIGDGGGAITYIRADMRTVTFDEPVDVWHDRAALHFLTERADQAAYGARAAAAVRPGGHAVLAVFSSVGPEQCSGLPVTRHSPSSLAELMGDSFTLLESFEQDHRTPSGANQRFVHALLERNG